ncbi:uncharacterized protein LOC123428933 [Hordeum vulgare subsp. vulgare]|uniref:uncharacterized protein LOC123428933 n=1 Tax=Hordeum vulgare subsp. vulgare TaxID=112509 RepID=UPI001D1A53F4|nr:uncharacterized protein LOC123428933 [Hordeum vulgare subsp. vulgare]
MVIVAVGGGLRRCKASWVHGGCRRAGGGLRWRWRAGWTGVWRRIGGGCRRWLGGGCRRWLGGGCRRRLGFGSRRWLGFRSRRRLGLGSRRCWRLGCGCGSRRRWRRGCRRGSRRRWRSGRGSRRHWRLGTWRGGCAAAAEHADNAPIVAADDAERQVDALAHAQALEGTAQNLREAPDHALHRPVQLRIRHARRQGDFCGANGRRRGRDGLQIDEASQGHEGEEEEDGAGGSHSAVVV